MPGSRIVPTSQLVFSAELAETLGLEEAVLVQQLQGLYQHLPATRVDGIDWLHVSSAYLQQLLPFWSEVDLQRICASLEAQGLLRVDRRNTSGDSVLFALCDGESPASSTPSTAAARRDAPAATRSPSATATSGEKQAIAAGSTTVAREPAPARAEGEPLPPDFTPSEDMLELLERFHTVPRDFSLRQLEDFTLYWRERGSAGHAWQNKFKQHVLFHWARHQQGQGAGRDHEGQHGSQNKGQPGTGSGGRTRDRSLEQDLTDTSWAD